MQHTDRQPEVHFACAPGYLDMYSLSYRWFGAVWTYNERYQRLVRGYWFADGQHDVIECAKHSGWDSFVVVRDATIIKQIYTTIRSKQQALDWDKRSRIPLRDALNEQWRSIKTGYYIFQSREQYPFYLSCIEKKGWLAYIRHATVCENDDDKMAFMNKVNREHNIRLNECKTIGGRH
ncbi:hypothetical protein [Paenibacillus glycinis]|uniref:Uncharacterized protein n=1 Tax=Paenibacillus glycinis TaxID=2697035 RepID=A0ABW9XR90_9BACL|nr:hypothetical protein [Paenibacillus glycinis]NBD24926.1 hypothetical protein [Paenibacillus glycinis]